MPFRTPASAWPATPIADVERRLRQFDGVLRSSTRADGAVDLVKAKALAGKDRYVSLLVSEVRQGREGSTLTPAQAQAEFLALQTALSSARRYDTNGDGKLNYQETVDFDQRAERKPDAAARQLVLRAAEPTDLKQGDVRMSKETSSKQARLDAEKRITELAEFHAATPEGAEALKWAMRLEVARGSGTTWKKSPVFDAINHSETDWRAFIPYLGAKYLKGRGHLSNGELEARFGPLKAFSERTAKEVNSLLLMDYRTGFLAGKDLP